MSLLLLSCSEPKPPLKVKIGQVFPQLMVNDLNGKKINLQFDSGKVTILNVWATWCGPCRHEMPSLNQLNEKLKNDGYQVIGISVDHDDHIVREFLIERKVTFTNYIEPGMADVNNVLGLRAFPSTFIIDGNGKLLKIVEGWRTWDSDDMVQELVSLTR